MKLITIPYAGGNRFSLKNFLPHLTNNFQCVNLELPGHGKRIAQDLLYTIPEIIDDLYKQILPHLNEDYFLYGHSMGGVLGNSLIHYLEEKSKRKPLFFLITGSAAPQFRKYDVLFSELSDEGLIAELDSWGGFEEGVLKNKELMDFFLPIIRADLIALEQFDYRPMNKHEVPITLVTGSTEKINEEQINGWEIETTARFESYVYEGDHFFIFNHFKNY